MRLRLSFLSNMENAAAYCGKRIFRICVSFLTFLVFFVMAGTVSAAVVLVDAHLTKDSVWENDVFLEGQIIVEKGVTLTLKPGTRVLFKKKDADGDGVSETSILVRGNIVAVGAKENPVYFTSAEQNKDWGDWKEIQINHAAGIKFEYCIFEYAEYGLHIHFSEGKVKNCIFRHNNDATRLGNAKLVFERNLFEKNEGKALNFTNSDITFNNNTVRNNREGVFVFERPGRPLIKNNNIYANDTDVKTGDFFKGILVLGENYFGKSPVIHSSISYSKVSAPFLGILPDIKDSYVVFKFETKGFVDGEGSWDEQYIFFPSFDGNIYAYSLSDSTVQAINAGDFTDSAPVSYKGGLYFLNWAGEITAVDFSSGKTLWKQTFKKTPKDDHRMPSPLRYENNIVAVSQGGHIMVINAETGETVFDRFTGYECRATPVLLENIIYFPFVNGTVLSLNMADFAVSMTKFEASFYSSPLTHAGFLYFLDKNGKLFLTDKSLNTLNTFRLNGSFRYQSPVVADGVLYAFSLDGKILGLSGEVISEVQTKETFTATPALYYDYIVAPALSGHIYFYKSGGGFAPGGFGEIQFKPLVINDVIFFGSRDNKIYGIKPW